MTTHTIAVLSDSHGNGTAMRAVLADAEKFNVDEIWSLGDIAFGGPSSEDCYQLLSEVNTTQYLKGNWESAYNMFTDTKKINLDDPTQVYYAMLVAYDYDRFGPERDKQLHELPMTGRKEMDGLTISLTHNLPNINRGHTLFPVEAQENFDAITPDEDVDIAIYAHTHTPLWRYTSSEQMVLNPGSVGQSWFTRQKFLADRDASYLLLTLADGKVMDVHFRRVLFSWETEIQIAKDRHFPYVSVYQHLLETGNASTHNAEVLGKINDAHNYRQTVIDFLKELEEK
ncbi:metallophosphoesterase family protein [Secundilactobacillus paracollinoides]|uniref:Diadenosine tetraphosphatase n=1 Tax=Secundilactobacillus paracollinoides TaxID=240427 RepID=A0A1B2IV69_9LACO|nr:metallophosphoesterase family protein [Secundilactobacillus paracollinoides]ANZ60148.1 diadenosine tetraphosphatase [Secundilactobacillus paracollinoides]ANZ65942.1 diadenosine tetraphosphatase [Secundilactobacillus paracollinoides]